MMHASLPRVCLSARAQKKKIPVAGGRYHPTSIMFAEKGSIYVANSKDELVGPAAARRKKIGSFSVDLPTLGPMVDRNFTL